MPQQQRLRLAPRGFGAPPTPTAPPPLRSASEGRSPTLPPPPEDVAPHATPPTEDAATRHLARIHSRLRWKLGSAAATTTASRAAGASTLNRGAMPGDACWALSFDASHTFDFRHERGPVTDNAGARSLALGQAPLRLVRPACVEGVRVRGSGSGGGGGGSGGGSGDNFDESFDIEPLTFWGVWFIVAAAVRLKRPLRRRAQVLEQVDRARHLAAVQRASLRIQLTAHDADPRVCSSRLLSTWLRSSSEAVEHTRAAQLHPQRSTAVHRLMLSAGNAPEMRRARGIGAPRIHTARLLRPPAPPAPQPQPPSARGPANEHRRRRRRPPRIHTAPTSTPTCHYSGHCAGGLARAWTARSAAPNRLAAAPAAATLGMFIFDGVPRNDDAVITTTADDADAATTEDEAAEQQQQQPGPHGDDSGDAALVDAFGDAFCGGASLTEADIASWTPRGAMEGVGIPSLGPIGAAEARVDEQCDGGGSGGSGGSGSGTDAPALSVSSIRLRRAALPVAHLAMLRRPLHEEDVADDPLPTARHHPTATYPPRPPASHPQGSRRCRGSVSGSGNSIGESSTVAAREMRFQRRVELNEFHRDSLERLQVAGMRRQRALGLKRALLMHRLQHAERLPRRAVFEELREAVESQRVQDAFRDLTVQRERWFTSFQNSIEATCVYADVCELLHVMRTHFVEPGVGDDADHLAPGTFHSLVAGITDDALASPSVQFLLCHAAPAYDVPYLDFREALELRGVHYIVGGAGAGLRWNPIVERLTAAY